MAEKEIAKSIKKIGVLTSGGDAPGMNAAIRAVVRTARFNSIAVKGIYKGYNGLIYNDMIDMTLRSVSGTLQRGGTILHTARSKEFMEDPGIEIAYKNCKYVGIDALVVIGGDGSFRGARDISAKGMPVVCLPGTIDNDVACTEYTIGFDTAVNTVVENIDKLRDTSESHNRCSVVEVMGRNCGDIALQASISCGAECVLIPEIECDIDRDVVSLIDGAFVNGKTHFIVIVAEGVMFKGFGKDEIKNTEDLAAYIQDKTGLESRATVIGHVQRGGSPTIRDRVVASQMGNYAVELLMNGVYNRVVAMQKGKIVDVDITEALSMKNKVDKKLFEVFKQIS